jgi:hypothetical protein
MKGHGTKFGRKKGEAVAALLTQRNIEEAARELRAQLHRRAAGQPAE